MAAIQIGLRGLLIVLTVQAFILSSSGAEQDSGDESPHSKNSRKLSGELEFVLHDAVFRGPSPEEGTQNLVVYTEVDHGLWTKAWGLAHECTKGLHFGLIRNATADEGKLTLQLEMKLGDDQWARGGRGAYTIELNRSGDGHLEGTFAGLFRGIQISGRAVGVLRPPRPMRANDFKPVRPGEHPRMLFRKHDLAALRKKLKTSFGQAYLGKARQSGDLISLGMLYQLTGDKSYADRAMKTIREFGGDLDPKPSGSGSTGHRLAQVAFAYDLCYDGWPKDFRDELTDGLLDRVKYRQRRLHPGHANYHPCSNYYGPSHGSSGLASLAVWQEQGPEPQQPTAPFNAREPSGEVAPASDYEPGRGVPVSKFVSGVLPAEWLFACGFRPQPGQDPLGALGSAAAARPEAGTRVSCGDRTDSFHLIPHEEDKGYWVHPTWTKGRPAIDITNAVGRIYNSTSYFFTVVDNDRPRWARLTTDWDPAEVYLAGESVRHGDVVHLEKGLYPLFVVTTIGEVPSHARILMQPRMIELSEEQAQVIIADKRAAQQFEVDLWQEDRRAWEESGGVDPAKDFYMQAARSRCYWHYRLGIGDGGFQAETGSHYSGIGSWYPVVYATAYRKVFGKDASSHPDVTHLVPRRMMQVVFRDDGSQLYQMINSGTGFDVGWRWSTAAFPIVPEEYKPAILWAWNRVTGVAGSGTAENAFPDVPTKGDERSGLNLAHTFIHYPLEMRPEHPSKVMPLSWEAPDFGFYCFRSGWEGKNEFVGQVFLKAKPVVGWNHGNAGTLRLLGLGHEWVQGSLGRNGVRAQEPVVWLSEDATNEGGSAQLETLRTDKDGSATMSIDLSDVHRPADDERVLYDRNLVRQAERPVGPITAQRAIAFDYSGRSGAPCLLVLLDKVQGGKSKQWLWQLPEEGAKKEKIRPSVQVEGNTFTIDYGDASLKATFLAPPRVRLDAGTENIQVRDARHGYHGPIRRVKATGGDEFFVVMTIQRDAPPAVETKGAGLKATATVGRQTVRFDGKNIVLTPLD